jgi:hypothetical protein
MKKEKENKKAENGRKRRIKNVSEDVEEVALPRPCA